MRQSKFFAAFFAFGALGIGGGGATSSYSISPYSELRFVASDMGTLFRSVDGGRHWQGVDHREIYMSSDLPNAGPVGFSADKRTVFYATAGLDPKVSADSGVHWKPLPLPLEKDERVRYWASDPRDRAFLLCATTRGLLSSQDNGKSWTRVNGVSGQSVGTFVRHPEKGARTVYHATSERVFRDGISWYTPPSGVTLRGFAGGSDPTGITLAFIDGKNVWVAHGDEPRFEKSRQQAGDFVRMAENDSTTIYVTGGMNWDRAMGTKVWISRDAGATWRLVFHLYDWDKRPYAPWPKDRLEYSAVGLDIGWDDAGYYSFAVNPANSADAGGTGNYFLHTTRDFGATWQAPFTEYADEGPREKGKRWRSTGLEVTSVLKLKFSPGNSKLGYASLADLGGWVTEDGGKTWRISKAKYNTNYDYALDPAHADWVYAASGAKHDFPIMNREPVTAEGGIFLSKDRGRTWERLTPEKGEWNRQFLSVAFDPARKIIYGGTHGAGVIRSRDGGRTWEALAKGMAPGPAIIPQLELDPKNGDVYALVTGNNSGGIFVLSGGQDEWRSLRGDGHWPYPTTFAVDFSRPKRDVLWLADWELAGSWLKTGVWKSTNRGGLWQRSVQFTHPTALTLHNGRIYVAGPHDPSWGQGGIMYSDNDGLEWKKDERIPYSRHPYAVAPDPAGGVFALFFGSGILRGSR